MYFGDGYGGIVAVFLFRIEAERAEIDEWLWVVFGDVPPAYLVTDIAKSPSQALEAYVAEVSKWTDSQKQVSPPKTSSQYMCLLLQRMQQMWSVE